MKRSSPNLEEIEFDVVNDVYFSLSFLYVFDFLMIFNFKSRLMVFLNISKNYFEHVRWEAVDDIPECFSDMTFNNLRIVMIMM